MSWKGLSLNLDVTTFILSISQYLNWCCYRIKPPCSFEVLSDVSHALRSPLPIFSNPLRQAVCVSMYLDKTASCTNWSQWHKLQGCVNKLHLHGNTCWQMCPLRSLQRYTAACNHVKPFSKCERTGNEPQAQRGRDSYCRSLVLLCLRDPSWKWNKTQNMWCIHDSHQMRRVW